MRFTAAFNTEFTECTEKEGRREREREREKEKKEEKKGELSAEARRTQRGREDTIRTGD